MAFNVNQFRSQLTGDGARPNLFEVSLPFPAFSAPGNAQTKTTFMCKTAQLPGSTLGVVPVQYFGRELKFVGNRTFADWTVTIINDEDFAVRNAFERWMNGINSHNLNVRNPIAGTPLGYSVDGQVTQFGKAGNTIKKYNFVGMFPTDITPIDVDWGSNDTIEEFSVTLTYQFWEAVADGVV
jgi:hypothetical protein